MDLEKYTNSKIYAFFEWSFKLIVWNLIAISLIVILAGTPMYIFFNNRDNKTVTNVEVINDNYEVTLKNGDKKEVGSTKYYGEITDFVLSDDFSKITFLVDDKIISIVNTDRTVKNIDTLYFDNNHLYSKYIDTIYDLGNIYDSNVDIESSKIDSNNRIVILLENGTEIIYGNVFNYSNLLDGILVFLAVILALFAFIPAYSTIFSMIKIYGDAGHSGTFVLFFNKSLWKLELIIIPFISLISMGIYLYFAIIRSTQNPSFIYTISYDLLLVCLGIFIIYILNIPMTVAYFRMRLKSIIIFTFRMTFRNFIYSIAYLILLAIPILLMFLNNLY